MIIKFERIMGCNFGEIMRSLKSKEHNNISIISETVARKSYCTAEEVKRAKKARE